MDELAQVGEQLATTADATLYQAQETGEVYHKQLTEQRKALVAAQAKAIQAQKDAESCHGKWTAQKTKQQVALHAEIERQRHDDEDNFRKGQTYHTWRTMPCCTYALQREPSRKFDKSTQE